MPNQMDKSMNEKTDRNQKATHLNDPTHRDLNAHGLQEQKGEFDDDLNTFDDLSLKNNKSDPSQESKRKEAQSNEGAKMGRGQIPQDKKSSPTMNSKEMEE